MSAPEPVVSAPTFPLISVVIPWIGRLDYIAAAVASLLKQDYANLEILISDNSLSTSVSQWLKNAIDPRIRIIDRSDVRLSSADHFTECVRAAGGEYVMILSDDDLIEPRYVSGMLEAIRLHPKSTVVLGEQTVIGKDYSLEPVGSAQHVVRHFDGAEFFLHRLLNPRALPIVTYVSLFARRSELLKFPYRNYPDGSNSDNFMMLRLALSGDVSVSSRKMYYRVYRESAGLTTPFSKLLESCVLFERDAAALLKDRVDFIHRVFFRIVIRVRNVSMMSRRLFQLYRKRLGVWGLLISSGRLIFYFVGMA
jgi:glycosyltransferase involved in cell wall biosynthesis